MLEEGDCRGRGLASRSPETGPALLQVEPLAGRSCCCFGRVGEVAGSRAGWAAACPYVGTSETSLCGLKPSGSRFHSKN